MGEIRTELLFEETGTRQWISRVVSMSASSQLPVEHHYSTQGLATIDDFGMILQGSYRPGRPPDRLMLSRLT